jgi:hypothetical protein
VVQNLSPDNLLLVTLPELDWREEKGGLVERAGQCRRRRQAELPPPLAELPGWIAGRLRRQQQSADGWMACVSSPSASKATCSPRTRKSSSLACSIRPAH